MPFWGRVSDSFNGNINVNVDVLRPSRGGVPAVPRAAFGGRGGEEDSEDRTDRKIPEVGQMSGGIKEI